MPANSHYPLLAASASAVRAKMLAVDPLTVLMLSEPATPELKSVHIPESRIEERLKLVPGYRVTSSTGLQEMLRFGWNNVEEWGVWTEGARSIIVFKLPNWFTLPAQLDLRVTAFLGKADQQTASIYLRERLVTTHEFLVESPTTISLMIEDQDMSEDLCIDLIIAVHAPVSPSEVGRGEDHRKIGLALNWIELAR